MIVDSAMARPALALAVACGVVASACASSAPPAPPATPTATPAAARSSPLVTSPPTGPLLTPTPTPSPSPWPLTVAYVSPTLAYRIQLPEGYRRSECLSSAPTDPRSTPFLGSETLTLLSPEEERSFSGHGHLPVVSSAEAWSFHVSAYGTDMPALELAERDRCLACDRQLPNPSPAPDPPTGGVPVDRIEALTIAGEEAARRIRDSGSFYVVRAGGRAYVIQFQEPYSPDPARPRPAELGPDPLASVVATFRAAASAPIVFRTARPQALSAAARDVATQVASAFEAGDVDRIAALTTPKCWLQVIVEPGGASAESPERYLAALRTRFAAGLRVRVAQVSGDGSNESPVSIHSEWVEGGRTFRVDLRLTEVDGRWYWGGLYQFFRP